MSCTNYKRIAKNKFLRRRGQNSTFGRALIRLARALLCCALCGAVSYGALSVL